MEADKLIALTGQRIGKLTVVELQQAFQDLDLEKWEMNKNEILSAVHNHDYQDLGNAVGLFLHMYHSQDINEHGGL